MARPYLLSLRLRQAVGLAEFGEHQDLEGLIRFLLAYPHLQRSAELDGRRIYLLHEAEDRRGVLLNLAVYTPDEDATVLPDPRQARPRGVATHPPPTNAHYVQGSLSYLITGNNVYCGRSGSRGDRPLQSLISQAAREAGVEFQDYAFELQDRIDVDAVRVLREEGVKSISFDGVASEVAVREADRAGAVAGVIGSVIDQLRSLAGEGAGAPEPRDDMKVHVSLTLDQRRAGLEVDRLVYEVARQTVEENEEGFKIVTSRNRELTADKVKFVKGIQLERFGNHPHHAAVWQALSVYHDELNRPGG